MSAKNVLDRAVRLVRRGGVAGSVRKARDLGADLWWDRRLGVETRASIGPAEIDLDGPNAVHASAPTMRGAAVVYATPRIVDLLAALRTVPADEPRHLVDYGCGKGRVLLAARQVGYASATGVELSRSVCAVARANVDAARRRRPAQYTAIEVVEGDAITFPIAPHHNVFYFYNPFGPPVLRPVIDAVVESVRTTPRTAWVMYLNHVHRDVMDDHPGLTIAADLTTPQYRSTLYRVTPAGVVPPRAAGSAPSAGPD